ncbi:MAG: hypothetical protein OXI79_05230 [Gammaproteobacteria bacterium]|nr:hypothetical protein [Gammaproteobacteria bacterium]
MKNMNLTQPPYDTSLVGVVKGALDYYGIDTAPAETFVLSGHAFVINIHPELCPSGPYCWNQERFRDLLPNLGIRMEQLGMLVAAAPAADKGELEARIRAELDQGSVCSSLSLDHQLVLGYDDAGFDLSQPWGEGVVDSTPRRLSFGTWQEFVQSPPVAFFKLEPCKRRSESTATASALDFAADFWRCPDQFAWETYGTGSQAYENWIAGLDSGHGDDHGNWWNAVVWGECRERAGDFFQRLAAAEYPGPVDPRPARELAVDYRALARLLYRASDKTASAAAKRGFVEQAKNLDERCIARIAEIRAH